MYVYKGACCDSLLKSSFALNLLFPYSDMKPSFFISLLTFVCLEVRCHTKQLSKESTFKLDICYSSYSCADCHTARICRSNAEENFESIGDINCPSQRPYCDHNTGTCVSKRPPNCAANFTNNLFGNNCNNIFSCLDCNTVKICKTTNSGLVHLKDLPCTDETPFCDPKTGTCGTQPSLGCGKKDEFICMRDGKFPGSDCYSYHLCTNLTSVAFSCVKPNGHYDPNTGSCSATVPCQSFSCLNNLGMKIPHPLDPRFFALCGDEGPIAIDSCPAPYELNVTSQQCEATCHYNGLLQDLDDCHSYYKCTRAFLTQSISYFIKEKKQCPEGQVFDSTEYMCVSKISNIPGCNV